MDAHRVHMEEYALKAGDTARSLVISDHKHAAILQHLQDPTAKIDAKLKHYIKKKGFQVMDLPALGITQALVVPKSKELQVNI